MKLELEDTNILDLTSKIGSTIWVIRRKDDGQRKQICRRCRQYQYYNIKRYHIFKDTLNGIAISKKRITMGYLKRTCWTGTDEVFFSEEEAKARVKILRAEAKQERKKRVKIIEQQQKDHIHSIHEYERFVKKAINELASMCICPPTTNIFICVKGPNCKECWRTFLFSKKAAIDGPPKEEEEK